jgi:lysophospholipid acyltransferase (LPLAT)-like uncharacterized protein
VKAPRALTLTVGPRLGAFGMTLLGKTLDVTRDVSSVAPFWAAGTPVIYAVWHGRVVMLPWLYGWRQVRTLASRSKDGEAVSRLIQRFGVQLARGSSTRGGLAGFRALLSSLNEGRDVLVVPDGPRGPREEVKRGIATLARLSGAPVVPVAVGASPEWCLPSWDRFRIPRPFARCVIRTGAPLHPGRERGQDEAMRAAIQRALTELTARVDREARA